MFFGKDLIMVNRDIGLIEYSKKVDAGNCITHAIAAVLAVAALVDLVLKAEGLRSVASAVIYGLSMIAVYTVSAVYHGITDKKKKEIARLVDHSTVPVLIAGTATPCALMTLYEISVPHALVVLFLGWFSAVFGLVAKLFFFEKTRKATVAVYIVACALMMGCAVPLLGQINIRAFGEIMAGNIIYLIGALCCLVGRKRPVMHVIFHIFTVLAGAAHFLTIYRFVI